MPKRIFISAGEPSGDLHGANLIRALRRLDPSIECIGFGGPHMEAAGARLLYPLTRLAVMWFARVLAHAPVFLSLLSRADRFFRHHKPDAVVLIDYPGFHWWLARRAHFHRIPVYYFVPPQLWAWAGWRISKMRRYVDRVLCSLPFEEAWYRERGVDAQYVGHPFFDELIDQRLDRAFMAEQPADTRPVVALLPGSRDQEIERNWPTLLRAAELIHAARPDVRFLVACYRAAQKNFVNEALKKPRERQISIMAFSGRTPEIMAVAHSCIAVSGSVGLELLYHGTPSVVMYRVGRLDLAVSRWLMKCRFISLVNLLAERELFPEYLSDNCEAEAISRHIVGWLNDPTAYEKMRAELEALRQCVGQAGACTRAATAIISDLDSRPIKFPLPPSPLGRTG